MQKKYIFGLLLAFLFFIQTLPVLAQGPQCVYCGIPLNNGNVGARTEGGYLCRNCYIKLSNMQNGGNPQQQGNSATYVCAQCHRQYSDGGMRTKIGLVCRSCYASMVKKCASCGEIIRGRGATDGTNYYCSSCVAKIQGQNNPSVGNSSGGLTCNNCNKKIGPTEQYATGRDYRGNNVIYCIACAQQSGLSKTIKCVKCNQVIQGAGYKSERDQYGNFIYTCAKCATDNNNHSGSTLCAVCHRPLNAQGNMSYRYGYTKNNVPYCMECSEKYKDRCKTCGLPIPPNGGVRNGSYLTCNLCSKDIVVTDAQLKQLYAQACSFMKEYFGLTVPVTPDKVYFSDMSEMSDAIITSREDDVPRTYGQNTVGLFSRRGNDMSIRVQKGMPKLEILETLVHEGAHACMSEFGYKQKASLMYSEGFAEWCAYKYLTSIGETQYYYNKSKRKDRIYGEGLRKMLELEKKMTADGLLDYIYKHNDFPQE